MTGPSSTWDRVAACGGIAFTVLALASSGATGSFPDIDADAATVRAYVDGHATGLGWGAVLMVLASLALVPLFGYLDRRLRADEAERADVSSLPAVTLLAGAVIVVLALVGAVLQGMLARQTAGLDDSSVLLAYRLWNLTTFSGPAVGVALYAPLVGARALRTGVLPRWLGIVGLVSTLGGLSSIAYIGTAESVSPAVDFGAFLLTCVFFSGVGVVALVGGRSPASSPAPAVAR